MWICFPNKKKNHVPPAAAAKIARAPLAVNHRLLAVRAAVKSGEKTT